MACPTTASFGTFDIYADTQDIVFSSTTSNSNSVKAGIASFDRLILSPDEDYYIQIRVLNGATPPASSTTINIAAFQGRRQGADPGPAIQSSKSGRSTGLAGRTLATQQWRGVAGLDPSPTPL